MLFEGIVLVTQLTDFGSQVVNHGNTLAQGVFEGLGPLRDWDLWGTWALREVTLSRISWIAWRQPERGDFSSIPLVLTVPYSCHRLADQDQQYILVVRSHLYVRCPLVANVTLNDGTFHCTPRVVPLPFFCDSRHQRLPLWPLSRQW